MSITQVAFKKCLFLGIATITTVMPVLFVRLNEPTFQLNAYKLLAKAGSLCGTVLLVWQFISGYHAVGGKLITDFIWSLNLHKAIGKCAIFLIVLHPVFITLYYLEKHGVNLWAFEKEAPFNVYMTVGIAAFAVLLAIVITSVFLRKKMSFTSWYGLHVTSYLMILALFLHSLPIGQTLADTSLSSAWIALLGFVVIAFAYRAIRQMGLGVSRYVVKDVKNVGDQAFELVCEPQKGQIKPKTGQFVYLRRGRAEAGRPFTVSKYDNGAISITVKVQGDYSTSLSTTKPGQELYLQGPYGVFLSKGLDSGRPIVMIAGGIGITPFYRLLCELNGKDAGLTLFYGNKTTDEIIYPEELNRFEGLKIVHVMSDQEDFTGEKGFVTLDLLKKHLDQDLKGYEFMICGPPVMIVKVEKALRDAGVDPHQIHHELFAF